MGMLWNVAQFQEAMRTQMRGLGGTEGWGGSRPVEQALQAKVGCRHRGRQGKTELN